MAIAVLEALAGWRGSGVAGFFPESSTPAPLPKVQCWVFNVEFMNCTWDNSSGPQSTNLTLYYWYREPRKECGQYIFTGSITSGCWFGSEDIDIYKNFNLDLLAPGEAGRHSKQEIKLQDQGADCTTEAAICLAQRRWAQTLYVPSPKPLQPLLWQCPAVESMEPCGPVGGQKATGVWVILMPRIPNLKSLDDLVTTHQGNFSTWSGVSKGLAESLQPDYSERLCHVSELPPKTGAQAEGCEVSPCSQHSPYWVPPPSYSLDPEP